MAVHVHTLDNGLSVYLSENHEEPWISCRVAIRAGAAQEPAESTGLAHYLEHMLANKGTRSLGTRDAAAEQPHLDRLRELYERLRETEGHARAELLARIDDENQAANRWAIANELKQVYGLLGARGLNAFTSHDRTVYVVDVPSNRLDAWARLEGNRFAEPVFRGFPTELETIIEEKNRALDNAGRVLSMAANSLIWAGHPYARDVLGEVEHLLAPSIAATERFFSTWYVPNNMAVILAGDLDPARALELVEAHFGELRRAELPPREAPALAPLGGEQRAGVVHRGDEEVRLVWRTVAREHEDAEALMLADMMLDNSSTGLLDTRLEQRQLVRSAGAFPSQRIQGGTETVWGRPRVDQGLDEVEALLREQVEALRAGEFSQADLNDLIANFEVGELRKLESNGARAAVMLDAFTHQREWDKVRTRLARLAAIDREQVVETARRWLGDELVVVQRSEGEPPVSKIPVFGLSELELDADSHSQLFTEVLSLPSPALELQVLRVGEHVERTQTRAGLLYRGQNPNNDLFQLTLRVATGSAHDPIIGKALALWARAGVGALDLEGYRRALFHAAAAVSLDSRRQQCTLTMAGRAPVLAEIFGLVRERLRAPVISETDRARWAEDLVGKRKQRRETTEFKFTTLKQWALRGPKSPYLAEALTNEQVLGLELDALRAAPAKLLEHERVVVYSGPHEQAELVELLGLDAAPIPVPDYQPLQFEARPEHELRVLVCHHEAAQTKLGLFAPSEGYDPARAALYRLFHEYVGGAAGLVFQEIRESRGLAYAAHGGHGAGARAGDQNLIWASLASRPDRAAEAAAVLLGLLREFPVQAQRFERARGSAIERLLGSRVRFRGYGFAAESWRLRGLKADPRPDILAALEALTIDDLRAFVRPLASAGLAMVVVGDTARMDMAALAQLGALELRELDELVVY
ncbi:Peptidase M16 inactive domain protein [Enhygromyxa salina]|uniref:Peptidase M16 inactive domain protein n=2 Tax=Enhygromyxa salina TaxID=215803 RepID=A0A2S9YL69_9BACT|nr:Peptidase M16 inactive domain protein [Enhygromyxa salina]